MDISIILPWTASLQQSSIQKYSTISTVIISLFAIIFSLFNFWWSDYRTGKIMVSNPLIYAMSLGYSKPESLRLEIPLVFLNTGGATRFVQDLKLTLEQNNKESKELYFANTSPSMDSAATHQLAQQFAIEGHKAYSATFFFFRTEVGFAPTVGACIGKLKARIDDKEWQLDS